MLKTQVELEKTLTMECENKFKREFEQAKSSATIGNTPTASAIITNLIVSLSQTIDKYLRDYAKGRSVHFTLAAKSIKRLKNVHVVALIVARVILNSFYSNRTIQSLHREIGQALENEWKAETFKKEKAAYYKTSKKDLDTKGASSKRIMAVLNHVFSKQLDFHLDSWDETEKIQAGIVLTRLFAEATGLIEIQDYFEKGKHKKRIVPTDIALKLIEDLNSKLSVLHPYFLPMVCPPKTWSGIFDGGYISSFLRRNKLIKNNSRDYLNKLKDNNMPIVYDAINHIQATKWQINQKVLEIAQALWEQGKTIADLPDREDEAVPPYPFPEITDKELLTEEQLQKVKAWKAEAYDIHKRNVQKRSIRIATAQIFRIALQFKDYEQIWFPYQMDFRGRLYPIPVLLQPQGSDLAKGLLRFAEGKQVAGNPKAVEWLEIHGANMFGFDKASYQERIDWVQQRKDEIQAIAKNPLDNLAWTEADKPFQFLAWCFEYAEYLKNPAEFRTHLPIQLDGTCNGLQHYSALLNDEVGGKAVNIVNTDTPSDIYAIVADKLQEKLKEIVNG